MTPLTPEQRAQRVAERTEQALRRQIAGMVITLAQAQGEIEQLQQELADADRDRDSVA